MSENRQALNIIIGSLTNLDVKLGNITHALDKEVFQVGQFVELYFQLGSIKQVIRRTVWQANSYGELVQLQLKCSCWDSFHHQSLPHEVSRVCS